LKISETRRAQTKAKLDELEKTNPKLAARKRRKAQKDRERHARNALAKKQGELANVPIAEKLSPVDE
jgi:hypothetical protein